MKTLLEIEDMEIVYDDRVVAVRDFSMRLNPREFVSLIGPSGCGKTTVLGAVAGFIPLSKGRLLMNGAPITKPAPERGVVTQDLAIFPWKTVASNVEFGLLMQGVEKTRRKTRVDAMLRSVEMQDWSTAYPHELSGGMLQRVALARALVNNPNLLLMDEPFGSLDEITRQKMQTVLLGLWSEQGMSVLFITHDIDEAVFLSDRVVVLSDGPCRPTHEIQVKLDRPRRLEQTLSREFLALREEAFRVLHAQTTNL